MATTRKKKEPVLPKEIGTTDSGRFDPMRLDRRGGLPRELVFPHSIYTYDEMAKNPTIAAALNAISLIALRVPRYIEPYDSSVTHKKRAEFLNECLGVTTPSNDMTHTFDDFIRETLSMNKYGFCITEKVFRVRRLKNGSKYDDGKVGIKRLPIRPQYSIEDFVYDEEGRDLLAIKQAVNTKNFKKSALSSLIDGNLKVIPRESFMLFNAEATNGSAISISPLAHVYEVWSELIKYKDLENIASSKNLNGLPVLWMPAENMVDDPEDPASEVFKVLRDGISKISVGQQTSLMLPSDREQDSGAGGKLYDFQLMSASSSNITAIQQTIKRLTDEILQCLSADWLKDGNEIDTAKTSLMIMLVEGRIREIFTRLNTDLIPHLWRLNGWDDTKLPQIKYGTLKEVSMADFAKAMQQTKATKLIAVTPKNINYIAEKLGLPERLDENLTQEELDKILGVEDKDDSKSGSGYSSDTGGLNGQGNSVSETDNSASNLDNK